MPTKYFDLHFEIGVLDTGKFYAETILGNNAIIYHGLGATPADAIYNLSTQLGSAGIYQLLTNAPQLARWPMGITQPTKKKKPPAAVPTTKPATKPKSSGRPYSKPFGHLGKSKKKDPVLHRPVDLGSILHPDCQPICKSYDFFGASKCKNMCKTKKGI